MADQTTCVGRSFVYHGLHNLATSAAHDHTKAATERARPVLPTGEYTAARAAHRAPNLARHGWADEPLD